MATIFVYLSKKLSKLSKTNFKQSNEKWAMIQRDVIIQSAIPIKKTNAPKQNCQPAF